MLKEMIMLAGSAYLIMLGMIMDTQNIRSFLFFKGMPFALGLMGVLIICKTVGWI